MLTTIVKANRGIISAILLWVSMMLNVPGEIIGLIGFALLGQWDDCRLVFNVWKQGVTGVPEYVRRALEP